MNIYNKLVVKRGAGWGGGVLIGNSITKFELILDSVSEILP